MRDKYQSVQSHMGIRMALTSMIRESLASHGGDQHKRDDGHSKINHDDARAFRGRKMGVLSRSLQPPSASHFLLKCFFHYFPFFFWSC